MQAKTGTTHAPLVSVVLMQAEFSNKLILRAPF